MICLVVPSLLLAQAEPAPKPGAEAVFVGAGDIDVRPDQVYGHKYGLALTYDVYTPRNNNGAAVLFINSGGYASGLMRQCEKGPDSAWTFLPIDPVGKWDLPRLILEQYSFERLLDAGFTVFDIRHGLVAEIHDRRDLRGLQPGREIYQVPRRGIRDRPGKDRDLGGERGRTPRPAIGARVVQGKTNYRDVTGAFELNRFPEPELETSSRVRAVAVYYPAGYDLVADLKEYPEIFKKLPSLNVEPAVLDACSIKKYLGSANPPVLIIYGDQDMPMILGASKNTAADLKKYGVDVSTIVLPGVGHEFKGKDGYGNAQPGQAAMRELVKWFEGRLLEMTGRYFQSLRTGNIPSGRTDSVLRSPGI